MRQLPSPEAVTLSGRIVDGVFQPDDHVSFTHRYDYFEGKRVWVIIENEELDRTLEQNNAYWKICELIAEHLGYLTKEAVHEGMKKKFLLVYPEGWAPVVGSTTKIKRNAYSKYICKVIHYAEVDLGCPNLQVFKSYV